MKKYWFGLIIFTAFWLLFFYKDSLSKKDEKVYVIYKKENFSKDKYKDIYRYEKEEVEGVMLELARLENKKILQKEYSEIENLNIITIDSLWNLLPSNFFMTHLLDKNRLDILERLRIFVIEVDSSKSRINIKEVRYYFSEYYIPLL